MPKNALNRWLNRLSYGRPIRPVRSGTMSEKRYCARLLYWEGQIAQRVDRLGQIRKCVKDFDRYRPPFRHKLVKLSLIRQDWIKSAYIYRGISGIFAIPIVLIMIASLQASEGFYSRLAQWYEPRRQQVPAIPSSCKSDEPLKHPILPEYLLFLFLSSEDREQIPGDLQEEYITTIVPKFGAKRATLWYWAQTIR